MRLFVAIELDRPVRKALLDIAHALHGFSRDVRWVSEAQMHVTVKFLGEVAEDRLPELRETCGKAAAGCTRFEFSVDHAGCFPPHGAVRIVWGGGGFTPKELTDCVGRCEDAFAALGFPKESRPFSPHITVGRVREDRSGGRLREAANKAACRRVRQRVESLTLFQSTLSPAGARYEALQRFAFADAE